LREALLDEQELVADQNGGEAWCDEGERGGGFAAELGEERGAAGLAVAGDQGAGGERVDLGRGVGDGSMRAPAEAARGGVRLDPDEGAVAADAGDDVRYADEPVAGAGLGEPAGARDGADLAAVGRDDDRAAVVERAGGDEAVGGAGLDAARPSSLSAATDLRSPSCLRSCMAISSGTKPRPRATSPNTASDSMKLCSPSHRPRGDHHIRIISARDATRHERRLYEETE
jgi:hypothetical protein